MEENNDELRKLKEAIAKSKNDENQKFEDYFKGLYDSLYKRYTIEYNSIQNREEKVSFLSGLLDEIIVAKHDEKHNFTISSIIARSKKKLDGLFKKFEYEIQDLTVFGKEKQTTEDNILNEKLEVMSLKLNHLFTFINEKDKSKITSEQSNRQKNIEDETWFKVFLCFANGKAYNLYQDKQKKSRKKIASELGFKESDGVWFSETYGNSSERSHNLYNSEEKYRAVLNHCKKKDIKMHPKFLENGKKFICN